MNLLEQYKQIKYPLEKKGYALACQQVSDRRTPKRDEWQQELIYQCWAVVELAKEEGHL